MFDRNCDRDCLRDDEKPVQKGKKRLRVQSFSQDGTIENLQFLVSNGINLSKPCLEPGELMDGTEEEPIRVKYGLTKVNKKIMIKLTAIDKLIFQDFCQTMRMTFLQRVARSACIVKSNYVIGQMMKARKAMAINQAKMTISSKFTSELQFCEINQTVNLNMNLT